MVLAPRSGFIRIGVKPRLSRNRRFPRPQSR